MVTINSAAYIGYARVSTNEQDTKVQIHALATIGCAKIYEETASGGRWDRPELHHLIDNLRSGEIVVVWKLDRLSRSLKDLLTIMEKIEAKGCGFRSITEAIDTTTAAGRMMMQIVATFAEFERAMIRERTKKGLAVARQEGRVGGRRPKLKDQQSKELAKLVLSGQLTQAEAARLFCVHRSTVSRLLHRTRSEIANP